MAVTGVPTFEEWRERRFAESRGSGLDALSTTECAVCGSALDDPEVDGDTCMACLGRYYGFQLAEMRIATAIKRVAYATLNTDPDILGKLLSEIAEHTIEVTEHIVPQSRE